MSGMLIVPLWLLERFESRCNQIAGLLDDFVIGDTLAVLALVTLVLGLGYQAGPTDVPWHLFGYLPAVTVGLAILALASAITRQNADSAAVLCVASLGVGLFTPASAAMPGLHTDRLWYVLAAMAALVCWIEGAEHKRLAKTSAARFNRALAFGLLAAPISMIAVYPAWAMVGFAAIVDAIIMFVRWRMSAARYTQPVPLASPVEA